ncbi:hypothetical protein PG993_002022 [Apiospora rasikravindrae]|uniref:Uncharacterized protein n=1 Tax=Apiospora rasikravindrae TaxID=990691 RepID=A0ABR1UFF2_9PEZI
MPVDIRTAAPCHVIHILFEFRGRNPRTNPISVLRACSAESSALFFLITGVAVAMVDFAGFLTGDGGVLVLVFFSEGTDEEV